MAEPFRLPEPIARALAALSTLPELQDYYLAGGTAIAAHLKHRVSRDLDFFSRRPDVALERIKRAVLRLDPKARIVAETDVALQLRVGGAPIDFVCYPYPPCEALDSMDGVALASPVDLAVMKLAAISRRGIRRDFWDLWALGRGGVSLADALAAYQRRFGVQEADLYHVLRSLTYFDDAERETTLPSGMTRASWSEIRAYFEEAAPKLLESR